MDGGPVSVDLADIRRGAVRRRGEGGIVKYIVISKLAPGVDNARQALEVFTKTGLPPGTEATWAGSDGKTFINIVETDAPDITASATYAPFFEETTVIPVVPVDNAWIEAARTAESNWG
jgi:hypothetical protein